MNLTRVSITGADDKTNPEKLLELSQQYPFVEWAILFSENKEGTQRYPSKAWREQFYAVAPNVQRAAHLCGAPKLKAFGDVDSALKEELSHYQRLQLNFNSKHLKPVIFDALVQQVKAKTFTYKDGTPIEVITQYNGANTQIHHQFRGDNHVVLFDASGGHGVALSDVPQPLEGIRCGYAGGLSPENLRNILENLKLAVGDAPIWIDMESGIRTDNEFDLDKVHSVLQQVQDFQSEYNSNYSQGM